MGRFDATKATIDANIKSNGNQEITGDILNSVMKGMVDATDAELTEQSAKLAELSAEIRISNLDVFNKYVGEIYAPNVSSSDVATLYIFRIAYFISGAYYNFMSFRDSNGATLLDFQKPYPTQEEALAAWSGVHWYLGNAFLLKGNPTESINYGAMPITFTKDFINSPLSIRLLLQDEDIKANKAEIEFIKKGDQVEDTLFPSVNLFNGEYDEGFWLSSGLNPYSGYYVTKPIKIEGGKSYKYPSNSASYGSNFPNYAFYDKYGNYIKVKKATTVGDFVILTEAEDCYVSVNIGDRAVMRDTFMFAEESQYPESYQPYRPTLRDGLYVSETAILLPNPLRGKILAVNGDSICAGAGYAGGYAKIIAERNEMFWQNIAVGGGTITSGIIASDGTPRHSISDTITNMREDADYILLEGGVNDAGLELPVGKIEASYYATFDTSTYCGAFEQMCKVLTSRFAGKKYGYIAVHQMVKGYRVTNTDKTTSYYWLAKSICEKWGVPFLDLNTQVPPFNYLENTDIKEVNRTYTNNGDGWHPNEEGYKKYYCDKIEAFMLSL